jgi:beta-fructofuranosidase
MGVARSSAFRLGQDGRVSFRLAGGYDPQRLTAAIVRRSDGAVLYRTTGLDDARSRCVAWSGRGGESVHIELVDRSPRGRVDVPGVGACEGRRALEQASDPYRPAFHFSPRKGWLNDPNGLAFFGGEYHLFFQHNPLAPAFGAMHWGHAVSPDLVHWRQLPEALSPPAPRDAADMSGIFSGSAVADGGALHLLYTIYTDASRHPGAAPERVALATSADGRTFAPSPSNPVIAAPPAGAGAGWRDPKVWRQDDGSYRLVVGSGDDATGLGSVQIYRSSDLVGWEHLGVLFAGDGTNGRMWECPDLFPLGSGKWGLLVSVNDAGRQQVLAFVGTFTDERFHPETAATLDEGTDFYAAQTFAAPDGRRIAFGWMSHWGARAPERLNGWAGAMSVPRELFVAPDGRLGRRPVRELERLRGPRAAALRERVVTGVVPLARPRGASLDIDATFDLAATTARRVGLIVRRSRDGAEQTRVAYDRDAGTLSIDRRRSGIGDRTPATGAILAPADGRLRLRVLVDRASVEVFTSEGRAVTAAVTPNFQGSEGVAAFAEGGSAQLAILDAWALQPASRPAAR